MPTIHETITIDRPRDEVWDFMSDPDNIPVYNSNISEFAQESPGERAKGTRDRGTVRVAGKRLDFVTEITEYEPGVRQVTRSVEAPMDMAWTLEMSMEDAGEGRTTVTFHQEVDQLGGFFGKLGDALVTRMYSKDVRANLEKAKEILEAG